MMSGMECASLLALWLRRSLLRVPDFGKRDSRGKGCSKLPHSTPDTGLARGRGEAFPLLALDLDGTLLRSDGTLSERTSDAVRRCREQGMRIVIASARPPRTIRNPLPVEFHDDVFICYNGAEAYLDGERVFLDPIQPPETKKILELAYACEPACHVSIEIDNTLWTDHPLDGPWEHEVVDLASVAHRPAAKVLVDLQQGAQAESLLQRLPSSCKALVTDGRTLAQVMSCSASKAVALRHVVEEWGLILDDVLAFGDDVNDVEMIRDCGVGVAMGNAVPEVKAVADHIAPSNDHDGVAEMLDRLLLLS
jgi:5-amino-6-(5-phospho-D-ribitylamino)uracil phosphatase